LHIFIFGVVKQLSTVKDKFLSKRTRLKKGIIVNSN